MEWTEDAINRLRTLWAEGHSTAEIGRRMGISKNAVVGKAHRLELTPRPSPIRREGQTPRAPRRAVTRRVSGPTLPPLAGTPPARPAAAEPRAIAAARAGDPPPPARPAPASAPASSLAPALARAPEPPAMRAAPEPRPVMQAAPAPVRPVAVSRSSSRTITCCWPIGEPGTAGFHFCDAGAQGGKPYCSEHAALAYVKVRDRREEAA